MSKILVLLAACCALAAANHNPCSDMVATYEIKSEFSWRGSSHPGTAPATYPSGGFMSPMCGYAHAKEGEMWMPGMKAQDGIKAIAEGGDCAPLEQEHSDCGADCGAYFSAPCMPNSGSDPSGFCTATTTVAVTNMATWLSTGNMFAPSPDWFSGSHNVQTCMDGEWVEEITMDLNSYDAGSDSGGSFLAEDDPTYPVGKITRFTGAGTPFSNGSATPKVGTITFTLMSLAPSGGAGGDPHLMGFDGRAFDYFGAPGAVFSLISTPEYALNAALVPETINGLTYMGAISLQTQEHRVQVSALPDTESVLVTVDDVAVSSSISTTSLEVSVQRTGASIRTPEVQMTIQLHLGQFLDLTSVSLRGEAPTSGSIHGVLGQTAQPEHAVAGFTGAEEEYFVSDLWATDFAHNLFVKSGKQPRKMGLPVITRETVTATDILTEAFVMNQ